MSEERAAQREDFLHVLSSAMRQNPFSSALIGMGLVWLFAGGRHAARAGIGAVSETIERSGAGIGESLQALGSQAASATNSVRGGAAAMVEKASSAAFSLTESAREIGRRAPSVDGEFFASARASLSDLFERQPLLLGAVGAAIGATAAASLPSMDSEVELLGDSSATLQDKAREVANKQMQRVSEVADGVVTTIAEEARVEGLTMEGLGKKAREMGESNLK
jgi:hypothetical protein